MGDGNVSKHLRTKENRILHRLKMATKREANAGGDRMHIPGWPGMAQANRDAFWECRRVRRNSA